MKINTTFLKSWLITLLFLSCLLLISCKKSDVTAFPGYNQEVIYYKDFMVSAEIEGLNSRVQGTVFVLKDPNNAKIRNLKIPFGVDIDPADQGGISIIFPTTWKVANLYSDFPQGHPNPENYISTSSLEYPPLSKTTIRIGLAFGETPGGGGKGNVLAELAPVSSETEPPQDIKITIGVGGKNNSIDLVTKTLTIPLDIK